MGGRSCHHGTLVFNSHILDHRNTCPTYGAIETVRQAIFDAIRHSSNAIAIAIHAKERYGEKRLQVDSTYPADKSIAQGKKSIHVCCCYPELDQVIFNEIIVPSLKQLLESSGCKEVRVEECRGEVFTEETSFLPFRTFAGVKVLHISWDPK